MGGIYEREVARSLQPPVSASTLERWFRRSPCFLGSLNRRACCALILAGLVASGYGQAKPPTAADARIYQEAMSWFKKAEAMIGTPAENSEEQAELFRKAIRVKQDFLEAHYNLGLVYANQKKMKEAVSELETVLKLEPAFDPPAGAAMVEFLIAAGYHQLGDLPASIRYLERGLLRKPEDLELLRALAQLQSDAKDDAGAIVTLQKIIAKAPSDAAARLGLGIAYQRSGRLDEAAAAYRAALKNNPKEFGAHYNLALICMAQKKNAEAAEHLEAADALKPGDPDILERLGDVLSFENRHDRAAIAYQAAATKLPDRAPLYSKLAFSLATINRPDEAIAALKKALNLDPRNAETYYLLGDLYSEVKKVDESVDAYRQSIRLAPKVKEVHYNLGTLLAEQQRLKEAADELRTAVDLDPSYAAAWVNLALVYERLELDKEAIQAFEKVVGLGKAEATNFFHLGVLYAKANQADPAIDAIAKAVEMEPEKYRQLLREELKKVHSVLDPIRYRERFVRLLSGPAPPARPQAEASGSG